MKNAKGREVRPGEPGETRTLNQRIKSFPLQNQPPRHVLATVEPADDLRWNDRLSPIAIAYQCHRCLLGWYEKPYLGWPRNMLATWALCHFHTNIVFSPTGLFDL